MFGTWFRRIPWAILAAVAFSATGSALAQSQAPTPTSNGSVPQPATPGPVTPPPSPRCSCGDRQGISRWYWHKTQCKRKLQECALGYPEEFNEWPLGSALYAHGRTQVANGNAARMVFYHYDFVEGSPQLNLRGRDKLLKTARLLPTSFAPIVVERTPSTPGLDTQRRSVVLAELGGSRFPVPPERVVIGPPVAHGLTGVEAVVIYDNQLGALRQSSAANVGGFSGGQGFDGSGLSGAAVAGGGVGGAGGR
jgi:hypothetical protein